MSSVAFEGLPNELTSEPLFRKISPSNSKHPIKILIVGGSVAQNLSFDGLDYGENFLAKKINQYYSTDRFVVYNAAFGGGKQPQQYFKYLYLDLIGFHPDIVINLDGFNEIALPIAENKPLGNPAIFPRSYSKLLHAATSDRSCASLNNKLLGVDSGIPMIEALIWEYVKACSKSIEGGDKQMPWWFDGMGFAAKEDYSARSVAIWEQSSNKLNMALKNRGIDYIHILQPNQYLEGSKIFSKEEREKYLGFDLYGAPIKLTYGLLSNKNLVNSNFRDQRYLFQNVSQTVYSDNCCHFNKLGMEYIINDIIFSNDEIFRRHLKKSYLALR